LLTSEGQGKLNFFGPKNQFTNKIYKNIASFFDHFSHITPGIFKSNNFSSNQIKFLWLLFTYNIQKIQIQKFLFQSNKISINPKHTLDYGISRYIDEHVNKGTLTFNGVDTTNCGKFTYVPLYDLSSWLSFVVIAKVYCF
jgi:hypothetical protein